MNNIDNWKVLWNARSSDLSSSNVLESLIKLNGFDHQSGEYTIDQWISMTQYYSNLLGLTNKSRVLEVGCGSGAFLMAIKNFSKAKIYGYDYSVKLIDAAKRYVDGTFSVSEARINPFSSIDFDCVVSHSVFQYFPNMEYAFETIKIMSSVLKEGGKIALLDLNDILYLESYHAKRQSAYPNPEEYEKKYANYKHLFFNKIELELFLIEQGFVDIFFPDFIISDYNNANLRFNVIGTKKI